MRVLAWGGLLLMGLAACGDDEGGSGGAGTGGSDATNASSGATTTGEATTATSTGSGAATVTSSASGGGVDDIFLCEETDFADDFPLSGPGFDPEVGIIGEPQETYLVATTQIFPRADKLADFGQAAGAVVQTLGESEGMIAFGIGSSATCGDSRTLSVWASEEAMLSFVASDAHAAAMIQAPDLSINGRATHWEVTAEELLELDWDVARDRVKDIPGLY